MGIYGICNYSLESLYKSLKKYNPEINKVDHDIVSIITDKSVLSKRLTKVNTTIDTSTYFVIGTRDYLKDLNILLADTNKDGEPIKVLGRKLTTCIQAQATLLKLKPETPQKLLKKTKPSVIKDILTVLYKIQNKSVRSEYNRAIFHCLKTGSFRQVSLILESKSKNAVKLKNTIESKEFLATREAIDLVKHGDSVSVASKKMKVSKFDINYILAFKESE